MIDLVNRRFVPFYFNRSGQGFGDDPAARAFTAGKTQNPYAYFAAFTPNGEYLGESELYADKDEVFAFLVELLAKHPEYAGFTDAEARLLRGAGEHADDATIRLGAAALLEELGDYAGATAHYEWIASVQPPAPEARDALLGLLRIHRHRAEWDAHARRHAELAALAVERDQDLTADLAVERGNALLAAQRYDDARALLQPLTRTTPPRARLAELHFCAGLACWFLDDRDWAKFHWVWIAEHLPEDRLARRAYVAAAAEAMPYANPELGDFAADVGNIGTEHITAGYAAARQVHDALAPFFERSDFTHALDADLGNVRDSALLLVAALRDGNEHVPANNLVVDRLVALGPAALPALVAALDDQAFPGRGYAAWALALVLKACPAPDADARARLEHAASHDENDYVRLLAGSGLMRLRVGER